MKALLVSAASAGLAYLAVACGPTSSTPGTPGAGGGTGASTSTGGGLGSTGGSAGSGGVTNSGGVSGSSGGGTGAVGNGGAGNSSGGAVSGGSGGSGGTGTGGSGGGVVVDRPGVVTSGPGAYWQVGTLQQGSGNATVTVNEASTLQQWIGFGGTFNEAGWDALSELPPAEIDRAIKLLFSASEGANFAWGRIPMGASDYALDRYTLNETVNDYQMTSFSIARDRENLIPYIKAAQAVKADLKFWASPWTPPSWMKTPASINGTDANGTFQAEMKSDAQTLQAHALYFVRFIEEYAKEGIPIDHVQPQNEPGYATRYPSCLWDAGLLGTFVGNYLGPALESRGLSTGIWFGTLSNNTAEIYSGHIGGLTGNAANYVTGVGLQWNTMPHVQELVGQGYLVMQTEHRCGNYPWETATFNPNQPPNDHAYAVESWGLIRDWIEAGVHAYSAWNMVLDTLGHNLDATRPWPQNALLIVDRGANVLTATPAYYVFRHLSYFVDPGAIRLGTTGGDALAFKNPNGSIVTVVHNAGSQPASATVAVGGTTVQVQVPAQGWATVNWKG